MGSGLHEMTPAGQPGALNGQEPHPSKKLSLYTMLVVGGLLLIVIVPLVAGLSVGLTKQHHGHRDPTSSLSIPPDASATGNVSAYPSSLWQPSAGLSWQITLSNMIAIDGVVVPDVDVYDIDLEAADTGTISKLHSNGKKVICYFSAGSYENWRLDANKFPSSDLGTNLDGWPGERWLNINSNGVRSVMSARIQSAASKGCDAIDPDNIDGYTYNNGFGLTKNDAINYVQFLSSEARKYNMACGLKNAGEIVESVLSDVHFCVQEQCVQFSDCGVYAPFVASGKPVFHIEYRGTTLSKLCSDTGASAGSAGFSSVLKNLNLDGWVQYCGGTEAITHLVGT